jgi:hypothetical protein
VKSYSDFVPTDSRAWHRAELLALLGGNAALLAQIEQAENDYLFRAGHAQACEADATIRDELKALAEAVETLQSIYNPGGSAKAVFEGEAFALLRGQPIQMMRDLFQGETGEALVMAAHTAADKFKVRKHREPALKVTERRHLAEAIATIAERAGIRIERLSRDGSKPPFAELLAFVFDRAGVEFERDSFIDEEIRQLKKARKTAPNTA